MQSGATFARTAFGPWGGFITGTRQCEMQETDPCPAKQNMAAALLAAAVAIVLCTVACGCSTPAPNCASFAQPLRLILEAPSH